MKSITARYFVTCLSCPDAFELENEYTDFIDKDEAGQGADMQMQMMQAMMSGQQAPGLQGAAQSLASNQQFMFSKMQNDLWECIDQTCFHIHRQFMEHIF